MPHEGAVLGEPLAALGAHVRTLARVHSAVRGQVALLGEGLAARGADERRLARVGPFVSHHAVLAVAGVGTVAALVPALRLAVRRLAVPVQVVTGGEQAVALPAPEGPRHLGARRLSLVFPASSSVLRYLSKSSITGTTIPFQFVYVSGGLWVPGILAQAFPSGHPCTVLYRFLGAEPFLLSRPSEGSLNGSAMRQIHGSYTLAAIS